MQGYTPAAVHYEPSVLGYTPAAVRYGPSLPTASGICVICVFDDAILTGMR